MTEAERTAMAGVLREIGITSKFANHDRFEAMELVRNDPDLRYLNLEYNYFIFKASDPKWSALVDNLLTAIHAIENEAQRRRDEDDAERRLSKSSAEWIGKELADAAEKQAQAMLNNAFITTGYNAEDEPIPARTCSLCRGPIRDGYCACVK